MSETNAPTPDERDDPANHRARTYERPDFPYRCGRERLWSLACGRGPNADGSCGGVSECMPTKRGDRWLCSRPLSAGGPCENGPRPDGGCYIKRPPCRPRSSIRAKRRHANVFALMISVSVIAAFFTSSSGLLGFDRNLSIPGALTAAHAVLVDGHRCGLCHEAHDREGLALISALVDDLDISTECISCHTFDGLARRPHNSAPMGQGRTEAVGCIGCHTEHKGRDADITRLPDQDCQHCHKPAAVFDDFTGRHGEPHPPFAPGFGQPAASAIDFDHAKHFDAHFRKAEHRDRRPETCESCHASTEFGTGIGIPSFEKGCAACHEEQIRDQPLSLLVWPEMEEMAPPSQDIEDACRIMATWDPDDFESTSYEIPGLIDSYLLGVDPDDMSQYGDAYQQLARSLVLDGLQPFADLIETKGGEADILLAGLSPETMINPACHWLANEEYEGFDQRVSHGWTAEPLSLTYHPGGHADPTLKAWIDYGLTLDADGHDLVGDLKASLIDADTGPGSCLTCHRASSGSAFRWQGAPKESAHTHFDHRPHLVLAEAADRDSCTDCHKPGGTAHGTADFAPIDVETCQQCHGKKGVGESCDLCHRYHPIR